MEKHNQCQFTPNIQQWGSDGSDSTGTTAINILTNPPLRHTIDLFNNNTAISHLSTVFLQWKRMEKKCTISSFLVQVWTLLLRLFIVLSNFCIVFRLSLSFVSLSCQTFEAARGILNSYVLKLHGYNLPWHAHTRTHMHWHTRTHTRALHSHTHTLSQPGHWDLLRQYACVPITKPVDGSLDVHIKATKRHYPGLAFGDAACELGDPNGEFVPRACKAYKMCLATPHNINNISFSWYSVSWMNTQAQTNTYIKIKTTVRLICLI